MALRSKKQKMFVQEYLIDLNATQAAIRAGYSKRTAKVMGYENLTKPYIQTEIKKEIDARSNRTHITQDMVLKEYAKLAFFDPRDFFDKDDNLKRIVDLDDDSAAALAGMDIQVRFTKNKDGELVKDMVKKIKLIDKRGALDSVAKHLNMFDKDNNRKVTIENIQVEFIE